MHLFQSPAEKVLQQLENFIRLFRDLLVDFVTDYIQLIQTRHFRALRRLIVQSFQVFIRRRVRLAECRRKDVNFHAAAKAIRWRRFKAVCN